VVARFARPRPSYAATCILDWYCASRIPVMRGNSGSFRFMLRGYSKFGCALLRMGKRGLVGYPEWQSGFDARPTKCIPYRSCYLTFPSTLDYYRDLNYSKFLPPTEDEENCSTVTCRNGTARHATCPWEVLYLIAGTLTCQLLALS
jgi:hypothetical protein